jgi:4-aminobutyrate aminotransferase
MVKQNIARGIGRMSDIVMIKGKGSWVWTADNRKLLDFTSGIAVTNLGHCHPRVVEAAQKQVATLVHGQVNKY